MTSPLTPPLGVRTPEGDQVRCERCGGPMRPSPAAERRFCSPRCRAAQHRAGRRAELFEALDGIERAARRLRAALAEDRKKDP